MILPPTPVAVAEVSRGARLNVAPLFILASAAVSYAGPANAEPNVSVAATVGGGLSNVGRSGGPSALFHLGSRADLLLLRERDADMAVGPYVEISTAGFSTAELGGGVEWLVPATEHVPIVFSLGAIARSVGGNGWEPGAVATIFAGSKSLNFTSVYGLGAGLFVQGRVGLFDSRQSDVILGAHVDLAIVSLPFVLAYNALRR